MFEGMGGGAPHRTVAASSDDSAGGARFGQVTIVVVPLDRSGAATLYRDGFAAGRFDGGPLTLAVRPGDVLAVHLDFGGVPAQIRVIAATTDLSQPRPGVWSVSPGATVLLPAVAGENAGSGAGGPS